MIIYKYFRKFKGHVLCVCFQREITYVSFQWEITYVTFIWEITYVAFKWEITFRKINVTELNTFILHHIKLNNKHKIIFPFSPAY